MKKQQQERSPRYRFWRNVGIIIVSGLIGGVIGVLTGLFGSEKPLEIQTFLVKKDSFWDSVVLFLSRVPDHDGLTDTGKKSSSQDAPNRRRR